MPYLSTVLVGLHLRLALSGFLLPNVSQCFNVFCSAVCASFSLLLFCFLHGLFGLFSPLFPPSSCWHFYGLCLIWASWPRQASWKFEIINVIDCATPTNQWCRQWLMGHRHSKPSSNHCASQLLPIVAIVEDAATAARLIRNRKRQIEELLRLQLQFCRLWLTRGAWPFNWVQTTFPAPFPLCSFHSFSDWTKRRKSQEIFVFLLTLEKSQKLIWNSLSSFCFANVCVGEAGKVAAKIKKLKLRVSSRDKREQQAARCTPWASGQVIRYNLAWFGNSCDGMTLETRDSRAMLGDAIWQSLFAVEWII